MSGDRRRALYAVLVGGLFATVALWRWDLFLAAGRATAFVLARGGAMRWYLLGEIVLFAGILLTTWRVLTVSEIRPAHDATVAALAALVGWAVEAWGTRTGVWAYYTAETPPLWIVPAWSLGAAFVERFAARTGRGPVPAAYYWTTAALTFACVASFLAPWLDRPAGWAALAAVAAALTVGVRPREEFRSLAVGLLCVFFADFWGATNGCWTYYLRGTPRGLWRGIGFGMALDAAVVLGVLRAARNLDKRHRYGFLS